MSLESNLNFSGNFVFPRITSASWMLWMQQVGECLHPDQLLLGAEHRRLAQLVPRRRRGFATRDVGAGAGGSGCQWLD